MKEYKLRGQRKELLEFLELHGSITNLQAMKIGIGRAASRVSELRAMGYPIDTVTKQVRKANGKYARVGVYVLVRDDGE